MREKYIKASDCFRRWTACLHTFVTDDRLRSGWFPRAQRGLSVPHVLLDPEPLNKFSLEQLKQAVDGGEEWQGRWGLGGQTSKPSTDPDLLLIETFYCSTPTTNVDPLRIQTFDWSKPWTDSDPQLIQTFDWSKPLTDPKPQLIHTFYWPKPSTIPNLLLFQTLYWSRPSTDLGPVFVVGFSPRIARRSTSWYRQIFAMPEFKGRCVLACLSKKQRQLFLHKSLPAISVDLSISDVATN